MLPHYADAVKACKRSPSGKIGLAIAAGEECQCTAASQLQREVAMRLAFADGGLGFIEDGDHAGRGAQSSGRGQQEVGVFAMTGRQGELDPVLPYAALATLECDVPHPRRADQRRKLAKRRSPELS